MKKITLLLVSIIISCTQTENIDNSKLTVEKARETIGIYLSSGGFFKLKEWGNLAEFYKWKGIIQISETEMHAKTSLNYKDAWTNNPSLIFVFHKSLDGVWVLDDIKKDDNQIWSEGFSNLINKSLYIEVRSFANKYNKKLQGKWHVTTNEDIDININPHLIYGEWWFSSDKFARIFYDKSAENQYGLKAIVSISKYKIEDDSIKFINPLTNSIEKGGSASINIGNNLITITSNDIILRLERIEKEDPQIRFNKEFLKKAAKDYRNRYNHYLENIQK